MYIYITDPSHLLDLLLNCYLKYTLPMTHMAQTCVLDTSCPPFFIIHGEPTHLGSSWKKWCQCYNLYFVAAGVTYDAQKKTILLHCGGEDLSELLDTLQKGRQSSTILEDMQKTR